MPAGSSESKSYTSSLLATHFLYFTSVDLISVMHCNPLTFLRISTLRPPMDEGNGDDKGKVVVMKTTRRIIRLQNNLQNTCDVPKPVPNIGCGVYSNAIEGDESTDFPAKLEENIVLSRRFTAVSDPETLLHLALESFHGRLDAQKLVKG